MKLFVSLWAFLLLLFSLAHGSDANEIPSSYQALIHRLSQDGFDSEFLSKLFADSRAGLLPELTTLSLTSKETPEFYAQFLSRESILLSKRFLHQNQKILRRTEDLFNVEKEVIVAILLVESRFGENVGRFRVIPTLASIALLDSEDALQKNYLLIRGMNQEISFESIESLARRKAQWAYHELKCFLRIIRHETIDPLEVYGSYAGALGMPQFVPSSYLAYAVSKNGFKSWLSDKEEAIYSIGNYLRSHGWKRELPTRKKKQILWCYNRSEPYIEIILQVAQKLRQK
ncbi:MAG: lytic murein transglycosylase [Syntrophaceae bacterium]|nr:lytic murein transglycosylase [Syntrophaceae bacterium]